VIQFGCPHCDGHFEIDEAAAGHETNCPACGGALIVPSLDEFGPPPPPDFAPPGFGPPPPPPEFGPPPPQQYGGAYGGYVAGPPGNFGDFGPPPPPDYGPPGYTPTDFAPPGFGPPPPGDFSAFGEFAEPPPVDYGPPAPPAYDESAWPQPAYEIPQAQAVDPCTYAPQPAAEAGFDLTPMVAPTAAPTVEPAYDPFEPPSAAAPEPVGGRRAAARAEQPDRTKRKREARPEPVIETTTFAAPSVLVPPPAADAEIFAPSAAASPAPAEAYLPEAYLPEAAAPVAPQPEALQPATDLLPPTASDLLPAAADPAAATEADRAEAQAKNRPLKAPDDPLAVREPTTKKIVDSKGQVKQLRRLTPEEKAARRFQRNMLLITFGLIILGALVAVLNYFGITGKP
jgi:hypothetical protein